MFPLALLDVLAMVGARFRLGVPFLLKECARVIFLVAESEEVEEVVFIPRLADALRA